jgi:hypothetical protein
MSDQQNTGSEPFIAGTPTQADLIWLCRHPHHTLVMVEIEGVFVPIILNENGDGPVIPEVKP